VDSADYIKRRAEFAFIPGSIQAIRDLTVSDFTTIVITNQSALARRFVSAEELDAIHAMMCREVAAAGGKITDIFFCPHLPSEGCACRKPAPGLIDQANQKHNIDLADAIMVGDSVKDIACGRNAGCGRTVLVKTGLGRDAENELLQKSITADFVAGNLREAVKWIISGKG